MRSAALRREHGVRQRKVRQELTLMLSDSKLPHDEHLPWQRVALVIRGGISVNGRSTRQDGSARDSSISPDQDRAERNVTEQVLHSLSATESPRLREIMVAMVEHLHAFAREVRLTEAEWNAAIDFLTRTGHITDAYRQEFILLSDVLGLSMLTVGINEPLSGDATEATVFGPFFASDSPAIELGGDIARGAKGEPCFVQGSVTNTDGEPIVGARIEVWEADEDGSYDVQYDDGRTNGRGHLFSGADGCFAFWGVTPTPYPIPDDGPVGELLTATGRSPMRPAHLHFLVAAGGYRRLVTHIFVRGDEHLTNDAVFGVKDSLIKEFERHLPGDHPPDGRTIEGSWTSTRFDIMLPPSIQPDHK